MLAAGVYSGYVVIRNPAESAWKGLHLVPAVFSVAEGGNNPSRQPQTFARALGEGGVRAGETLDMLFAHRLRRASAGTGGAKLLTSMSNGCVRSCLLSIWGTCGIWSFSDQRTTVLRIADSAFCAFGNWAGSKERLAASRKGINLKSDCCCGWWGRFAAAMVGRQMTRF